MDWDGPVPRHLAIIMDGNGRWASARGLPRVAGHEAGADSVRAIVRACGRLGVEVLTLYSFSTENWSRPDDEVQTLMTLLERYLREEQDDLQQNNVRLSAIGHLHRLPEPVRLGLEAVSASTAKNTGLRLVLALSYGGRAEIVDAVRRLATRVQEGELAPQAVDEAAISAHLYTEGLPDPDLLIRTSGELRLSNFLLWQVAYAEIYVTDVLWPDFREPGLIEAFRSFADRERRFGKTGAQIQAEA
ncbi:MAG: isoprenyl transferase [Deltaproteobacteria bacterium]|nr:MAG: isoprenyl transferase [Deltaproteobacteria bacterium]